MFALVTPFLAQTVTPSIPNQAVWIGVVVLVLGLLLSGANNLTAMVDRFKPKHAFQTKEDADQLELRMRTEIQALDDRSERRTKENRDLIQEKIQGLERVLSDKISENKTNNSKEFGELKGEVSSLRMSFQGMSNDIFHAIGKIQGQIGEEQGGLRVRKSR